MRRKIDRQIVGLDIGSSKVCAVIAEQREQGLEITGLGTHPCEGVIKGQVVDVNKTVEAISAAVAEAEKIAQKHIESVHVGVTNAQIKGVTSEGMLPLHNQEIGASHLERVIEAAESVMLPEDSEILHVLPQEFIVDDARGIKNPIGMQGARLLTNCYVVTVPSASIGNLVQCIHKCGLEIDEAVLGPLASAEAVLTREERELGAVLVDIGAGTTDVVVLAGGAVLYTVVLPYGGWNVTSDISQCLNLSNDAAEWLKKRHGHLCIGEVMPGEEVEVETADAGVQYVDQRDLCEIVEARVLEILHMVQAELRRTELDSQVARVVLTGGGSRMRGIVALGEAVFGGKRVRVGRPQHVGGLVDVASDPSFATAVGLVLLGAQDLGLSKFSRSEPSVLTRAGRKIKDIVGKLID